MTPIPMRLANADQKDTDTALAIGGMLNDLDDCNSPFRHCSIRTLKSIDNPEAEEKPGSNPLEDFDPEDGGHCKILVYRLLKLLDRSPGCLNRVLWGYSTLRSNNVIDLDSDHLAFHPEIIDAKGKSAITDSALRCLQFFIDQCRGDSGTGKSHWEQFPEYRIARDLLATHAPTKNEKPGTTNKAG